MESWPAELCSGIVQDQGQTTMEVERQVMMILVEVEVGTKFKTYSCRYIINNNVDRALEEANMYVKDTIIAGASPRPRSPLASPIHQNQ